jgi:hypothetical protein
MYKILRVSIHYTHICNLLSSLIFLITNILCLFLLLLSLHLVQTAAGDTLNSNPFFYWQVSSWMLMVGNWPILHGHKQSLPRTTKAKFPHHYMPIIDGGKCLSRTPKCNSRRSLAHESEDPKSNPLVCARKRWAKREPSLIVSLGRISWLMVSLLAFTRQKQLAMPSPNC